MNKKLEIGSFIWSHNLEIQGTRFNQPIGTVLASCHLYGSLIAQILRVDSPGELAVAIHEKIADLPGSPLHEKRYLLDQELFGTGEKRNVEVKGRYLLADLERARRELDAFLKENIEEILSALVTG